MKQSELTITETARGEVSVAAGGDEEVSVGAAVCVAGIVPTPLSLAVSVS